MIAGMAEGAVILIIGMALGRFWPARRRFKEKPILCQCEHAPSFHKEGGKCCWMEYGMVCKCQRYTGPEPLPEYYPPPISG